MKFYGCYFRDNVFNNSLKEQPKFFSDPPIFKQYENKKSREMLEERMFYMLSTNQLKLFRKAHAKGCCFTIAD